MPSRSRTSAGPRRCPIDKSSIIVTRERSRRQRSSQSQIKINRSERRRLQRSSSPIKQRSLPPELPDDVIGEILLRLPPAEPACLLRASLACKGWRRLVSDGAFLREYRAFHRRTPPVLGFFHDDDQYGRNSTIYVPNATMPATQPVPLPPAAMSARRSYRHTLDCRHGRVLFETQVDGAASSTLTVWDPLTGDHQCFALPLDLELDGFPFLGAVLCASAAYDGGCNHLECSGGAFLVVLVGISYDWIGDYYDIEGRSAWARVYSSETGVWGAPSATIDVDSSVHRDLRCSMLVGGAIHFMLGLGQSILKYDIVGGTLSVMEAPPELQDGLWVGEPNMIAFATTRDDELGAATLNGYSLHLWSWSSAAGGSVGEWTRVKVIDLGAMIQISIRHPKTEFELVGFAQGADLIFIRVNEEMFTFDLKSGHINKTGKRGCYGDIFPLVSFFTPDRISAGLQAVPMMID